MNYTTVLAAGVAAVSLGAVNANSVQAASSQFVKEAGIVEISGSVNPHVYSQAGSGRTNRTLPIYSTWKTYGYTEVNGTKWYNLGGNQWVNSESTNFMKTSTSTLYYGATPRNGVVTINYKPGYGIAVFSQPGHGAIPGRYLKHGTSWKYFQTANVNGMLWYNLGGNQWISAQYASSNSPEAVAKYSYAKIGVQRITNPKGAKVYSDPNSGTPTGKVLPAGSRWKSFRVLNNGVIWYNLGGNQWISSTDTY